MQLLPRNETFFDELEALAGIVGRASEIALGRNAPAATAARAARRESGSLTRRTVQALQKSFIPPLDRDDLHEATLRLDAVVSSLDWACFCRAQAETGLATLVLSTQAPVETLIAAVRKLRDRGQHEQARALCDQLLDLEDRVEEERRAAWPVLLQDPTRGLLLHTSATALVRVAAACRAAGDALQAALFDS